MKDICYIMDSAYTADEVLEMECTILNRLKFGVTYSSPLQFLDLYLRRNKEEHWKWNKQGNELSYVGCFQVLQVCVRKSVNGAFPHPAICLRKQDRSRTASNDARTAWPLKSRANEF